MLNKIFAKIESLIADYEKTGNKKKLDTLYCFCCTMGSILIKNLSAIEIQKIPTIVFSMLYDSQNELTDLRNAGNRQEEVYKKCKDIYNLVMEHKNENW